MKKATVLLCVVFAVQAFAARPAFTPDDLWNWRSASDPRISPDGQWVVYVESWNNRAANAVNANLWLVSSEGRARRRFTEGNWNDRSPRWSPDSTRISWLSDRGGRTEICTRSLEGADAHVIPLEHAATAIAWSPDGKSIGFSARVPKHTTPPAWAPEGILARLSGIRDSIGVLFAVAASGTEVKQVSTGACDVSGEPSWMLDGQAMVAACGDGQVWLFPVSGAPARPLTHDTARTENPLVAPDGSRIAWLATAGADQFYATRKLYVMNPDGTRAKCVSGSLDRDATAPAWSSDARTLYFLADDRGATHVYAARADGTVRQVTTAAERLRDFSLADNGRAVAIRSTISEAESVFTFTVDHVSQPATLASPNEHLLAEREIGATEQIRFESGGQAVDAWVVKPPGFDASRKYALLLDIRDEPRRMYGSELNLRAQIAAAREFVVLCVNPRGTPGYGEIFGNLLHTALPGDDYDDLIRAMEAVVAKGYVDPKRLTVSGGLLAPWAIGHTDRFHAAVARRPIANWVTHFATAPDGLERARAWMGAMPWENPEQYVKHSPIFFAQNFHTPTLVLAEEGDPEADELFFALKARKVECAMVRLPATATPADKILELETELRWLSR